MVYDAKRAKKVSVSIINVSDSKSYMVRGYAGQFKTTQAKPKYSQKFSQRKVYLVKFAQ